MVEQVDTIVIGGGQAGLSVSWHLMSSQREHLVLDRGNVGDTWRHRWDSFCLVTPNRFCLLPGFTNDFSWIDLPIFDDRGYPGYERGVTEMPGFYFVGLHWMHTAGSGLFSQVGRDAEYVVGHLTRRR